MKVYKRLIILIVLFLSASTLYAENDNTGSGETGQEEERFGPPIRSVTPAAQSANRIDISQGGSVCYSTPAALELWRPYVDQAAWLTIQNLQGPHQTRIPWPMKRRTLEWPLERVPVNATAKYRLQYGNSLVAVDLYPIPLDLADERAQIAWMQKKGCFW